MGGGLSWALYFLAPYVLLSFKQSFPPENAGSCPGFGTLQVQVCWTARRGNRQIWRTPNYQPKEETCLDRIPSSNIQYLRHGQAWGDFVCRLPCGPIGSTVGPCCLARTEEIRGRLGHVKIQTVAKMSVNLPLISPVAGIPEERMGDCRIKTPKTKPFLIGSSIDIYIYIY